MRRSIAGAAAAALGAATAVAALAIGTTTGVAATGTSEAFGVSAAGAIPIDPMPMIASSDGTLQTDELVNVPLGDNGEVRAATLTAGDNVASVELAGLALTSDMGGITASVLKVACEGTTGTVSIADLNLNGTPVVLPPADQNPVNEVIEVPGVAKITYNKQTTNADGSFNVTALEIVLLEETETVTIGSATCAPAAGDDDDDDDGDDGDDNDGPTATSPAPITTGLPVTG